MNKAEVLVRALDARFIGREIETRAVVASVIGQFNALMIGPPGTAKTAIIDALVSGIDGLKGFYACMSADVTPEAIWGPMDFAALQSKGEWRINTAGHAAEADVVTVDETFRANSVVCDSLLDPMMNKRFKSNGMLTAIPAISFFGASNFLPAPGSGFDAFLDRWHLRMFCDYMSDGQMDSALGRRFQDDDTLGTSFPAPFIPKNDLIQWQTETKAIGFTRDVQVCLPEVIKGIRAAGLPISDRTAIRVAGWMRPFAYIDNALKVKRSHLRETLLLTTWTDDAQLKTLHDTIDAVLGGIPEEAEDLDLVIKEAIADIANAPDQTAVANILARSRFVGRDDDVRNAANLRIVELDVAFKKQSIINDLFFTKDIAALKVMQKRPEVKTAINNDPDIEEAYKEASARCMRNLLDRE